MSQQTGSSAIHLAQPAAGQTVNIPINADNMRLALDFAPDPNAVAKNGQNLEFTFENGGKLVLDGYYDHFTSKTLPVMVTENGDELAGEDFLASLREDLLTAAGPGAGAGAAGSGAGEYADDPGALVDGVNRLGSLGTIYWDRATEVPEDYREIEAPGGTFGLDVQTNFEGVFRAGVYEDGRPEQHLYGDGAQRIPGQIFFNPELTGTTVVTGVHLSGFPAGTRICVGDPSNPDNWLTVTGPDQVLDFTQANFTVDGVYVIPPLNSDADMNISAVVDLLAQSSGVTDSINGSFTIIVDAVADKPDLAAPDAGIGTDGYEGAMKVEETDKTQQYKDGWAKDSVGKTADGTLVDASNVTLTVKFHATLTFGDFGDGSERHFALVEVPSNDNIANKEFEAGDWIFKGGTASEGLTYYDTVTIYYVNGTAYDSESDARAHGWTDGGDSKTFFRFEADNDYLRQHVDSQDPPRAVIDIEFEMEGTGSGITGDTQFNLEAGAQAKEEPGDSGELDLDNNNSYTWASDGEGGSTVPLDVDTVDSTLTLKAGWVAEDNSPNKNLLPDSSQGSDKWTEQSYENEEDAPSAPNYQKPDEGSHSDGKGAPLSLSISGGTLPDGSDAGEHITGVSFTFDPEQAIFRVGDVELTEANSPYTDAHGITYTYGASTGTVTISNLPSDMTDMSDLGMNFVPNVQYSDEDIPFTYTVDVESSSGAKAHYAGDSTVVVDAVADLSGEVTSSIEGKNIETGTDDAKLVTSDETGGRAGDGVEDFHDKKGWETDTYKLDYSEAEYTFTVHVETSFPDTDGSEKHYILVEKPDGGTWKLGDLPEGLKYPDGDATIEIGGKTYWKLEVTDSALRDVSVDIPLKGTGIEGDTTLTLQTGSYVEEQNNGTQDDREYDLTNNTAVRTDGTSVTYTIDVLNSELTVKTGWASEGGNDAKHLGNANGAGYQVTGDYKDSTGANGTAYDGSAPITLNLSGAAGSAETITSVTFTFDSTRGTLMLGPGGSGTLTNNGDGTWTLSGVNAGSVTVYFKPAPGYDYSDVKLEYSVTVGNGSGSEYEFNGSSQIVIDAVADKPVASANSNGSQVDYPGHDTGHEQGAAKPGDTVTVHGKVTFPDASGGENHFILIENGKTAGDLYDLQSIKITAGGQTLELTAAQIQSMLIAGTITTVTVGGVTYYRIPTDGNFTDAGKIASFDVDITVKTSGETTHNNSVGFGGQADVAKVGDPGGNASADYEFDKGNNSSTTVGSVTVRTEVVDTKEVTINVGSAYENADRNANEGFVARADMLDAGGQFKPEYLADIKNDSAAITIGAVNGNEDLIGLAIMIPEGSGGFLLGDAFFMPGTEGTVTLGGIEISVSWTYDTDGNPILNITVPAGGNGDLSALLNGNLWFVPEENFSSKDVELKFGAVVEDNSSGYTKGFGDEDMAKELGGKLGIDTGNSNDWAQNTGTVGGADHTAEVDAVAQQAGMEATVEGVFNGDHVVPGTNATVHLEVDLRGDITDGTESHFFMVEAKPGYGIVTITITYEDADGITRSVTLHADDMTLQRCGDNTYFQYDLGKLNPAIGDSELKIDVTLNTPGGQADGTSGSVSIGVISHEELSKITSGGDQEATLSNNTANALMDVEIPFSSCTKAGIILGGYVYENDNWDAHIGNTETEGRVVTLNISLGDANDYATEFNLELRAGSEDLGDLVVYDSDGNELFRGDKITLDDLKDIAASDPKWADCLDGDGNLVKIPGAIVFEPADDSYSGKDPQIDYTITLKDDDSGQTQTLSSEGNGKDPVLTITSDSVAQQPSELLIDGAEDATQDAVIGGGSFTKTISATFTDVDGSTTHYILIEAEAGWTITVNGKTYTPESTDDMFVHDGKVYYKIDVTAQVEHNASGHTGSASIEVTFTPPTDAIFAHANDNEYSIDVKAGSTDKAEGKEITFDNNTAVIDGGSVSGTLVHPHEGIWLFEQTAPLYEDNMPNQHIGDTTTEASGHFAVAGPDGSTIVIVVDTVNDGNGNMKPVLDISGPGVSYDANSGTYTIDVNTNGGQGVDVKLSDAYLKNGGANSDADLEFKSVTLVESGGAEHSLSGDGLKVVVDAVADYAKVAVSSETSYDDDPTTGLTEDGVVANIDSGKDAVAKFTVNATFNDTADGSERQYLLVEKTPAWSIEGENNPNYVITEVYIDGKTYYRLEVTGLVDDGQTSFDIYATYHGGHSGVKPDGTTTDGYDSHTGVTKYELNVGAMTQEGKFDGVEFDTGNNTSINLEGSVTLQYSPIDSQGGMSIDHKVVNEWGGEHDMQAVTLAITGIETGKSDVLTDLTINYTQSAGQLYLVDSNGNKLMAVNDGCNGFTAEQLAKLSSQEYKFSFEPNEHSHEDVSFSWSGTVKDTVSGATETVGGSQKLVVDAVADGSVNDYAVASEDGHDSVTSGADAVVTVIADFKDNTSDSEEHWVVLEQNDLRYSVKGVEVYDDQGNLVKTYGPDALVTKFDANGKPYWALNVSDIAGVGQGDCTVKFTVTTPEVTKDTDHTLGAGTIVIETSRDGQGGDREPDYNDNWTSDITDVTISTAVVEATTIKVEAETGSMNEDGDAMKLIFTVPDGDGTDSIKDVTIKVPANGTLIVNGQEHASGSVTITADELDKVYFKPNADWSGEVTLDITAGTLTDRASGAEKEATTLIDGSFTVLPVADAPELDSPTAGFSADGGLFEVTLAASLTDTDGSESLWFKVFVPEGLHLTGSYAHVDADGGYYLVPADAAGTANLAFTADSTWDPASGGTITYHAMSQEGADTANTADSGKGAITIDQDFDYRTEHLAAGDSGDFSTVAHNLHITGSDGDDTIHGGAGNDLIYGGAGDDTLIGGAGNDIIYGGAGNDTLTGGEGNDVFVWTGGDMPGAGQTFTDTITDFTWSADGEQDTIDLSALGLERTNLTAGCTADGNLTVSFDAPGGGTQVIVFENIHCTDQNAQQLISDMLTQQQIKGVSE